MEQIDESKVQELITIFQNCQNPNPLVREPAENIIINLNPSSIPILASICISDNVGKPPVVIKMATQILVRFLNPNSNRNGFSIFLQEWKSNPFLSQCVKSVAFKELSSQDPTLSNIAAQLIALIFGIEKEKIINNIASLIATLKSKQHDINTSTNIINIFIEIMNLNNFSQELCSQNFLELYFDLFLFCQNEIIACPANLAPNLRYSAASYIWNTILRCKAVISSPEIVHNLLNSMPNSFVVNDIKLYTLLYDILFSLLKQFYDYSDSFMPVLFQYIVNGLSVRDNIEMLSVPIAFCVELCQYEKELMNMNGGHSKQICALSAQPLITIFLNFLSPSNDVSDEESNILCDNAMKAIISFYNVCPPQTFAVISQRIIECNKSSVDWRDNYIMILLFLTIIDEPISATEVGSLVNEYFDDFILEKVVPASQNPDQLRFVSFLLIYKIIKNYSILLRSHPNDRDRIKIIISLMNCEGQNSYILSIYTKVIEGIAYIWKNDRYNSKIFQYYDELKMKLIEIWGICKEINDQLLIKKTVNAICALIKNSSFGNVRSDDNLDWYKDTLIELDNSYEILNPVVKFNIQSGLCAIIETFVSSLTVECKELDLTKVLHLSSEANVKMFRLLELKNNVFDEAALTVTTIMNNFREIFQAQQVADMYNISSLALKSESPSTINTASVLLTNLFEHFSDFLIPLTINVFNDLVNLLFTHSFMTTIHKNLLYCIAQLTINGNSEQIRQLEENIKKIIVDVMTTHIDYNNRSSMEYGSDLYFGLCELYISYLTIFMQELPENPSKELLKQERDQIIVLDNIAAKILKLGAYISNSVLTAFFAAMKLIVKRCNKGNVLVLKRRSISSLIKIGEKKENPLGSCVKDVVKLLVSKV